MATWAKARVVPPRAAAESSDAARDLSETLLRFLSRPLYPYRMEATIKVTEPAAMASTCSETLVAMVSQRSLGLITDGRSLAQRMIFVVVMPHRRSACAC